MVAVNSISVVCPCGCGVVTTAPIMGMMLVDYSEGKVDFNWKSPSDHWLFPFVIKFLNWNARRKGLNGLLCMFDTIDGRRFSCEPVKMSLTPSGFMATAELHELAPASRSL